MAVKGWDGPHPGRNRAPAIKSAKGDSVQIQNGDTVKDKVTGFTGVVTGVAEYLTGCRQCCVQPAAKDGEFKAAHWFDDDRLSIEPGTIRVNLDRKRDGGPQSNPAPTR
jgi:hypothetical protein